jgi:hypothetical protein
MIITDKDLNAAIALVQSRGLIVTPAPPWSYAWTTPSDVFIRFLHGSTKSRMYRRLRASSAPSFEAEFGDSGRLIALRPNRNLIDYLQRPNQGGKRL